MWESTACVSNLHRMAVEKLSNRLRMCHRVCHRVYAMQSCTNVPLCLAAELLADLRKREKEMDIEPDWNVHAFQKAQAIQGQPTSVATEYVIRMLGLDICADTICGNHMMRGISGGQKKRVTSGEKAGQVQPCSIEVQASSV